MNKFFLTTLGMMACGIGQAQSALADPDLIRDCQAPVRIADSGVEMSLKRGPRGHLLAEAEIAGRALTAVVDTGGMGVGGLVAADWLKDAGIGFDPGETLDAHGAHASAQQPVWVSDQLELAGVGTGKLLYLAVSDPIVNRYPALIGSRFLCQFQVEFDLAANRMGIRPRDSRRGPAADAPGWIELPFDDFMGTGGVIFEMAINGVPVRAALDTGSPFTAINWAAGRAAGLSPEHPAVREAHFEAHGLNDTDGSDAHVTALDVGLASGKLSRRDEDVRIRDGGALAQLFGDQPGMVLGLDWLEGRRFVIDYREHRLWLDAENNDTAP